MLMQSDGEKMEFLPALPDVWKEGEINGLKARGNYTVNLAWKEGKITKAEITSHEGGTLIAHYNGKQKTLKFKKGTTKILR